MAAPRRKTSVDWLTNSTVLSHAVRALASARRTAVLVMTRDGRQGEIAFERGAVVAARTHRLTGQDAFNHLVMWADVKYTLREESVPVTMRIKTDALLDVALSFAEQLDSGARVLGGPRATYTWQPAKLAELALELPAPVRAFAAGVNDGARLADLVEDSTFATSDALKICYRLCELGVLVVVDVKSTTSLPAQLAVLDWVLTANAAPAAPLAAKAPPAVPAPAAKKARADATAEVTTRKSKASITGRSSRLSKPFAKSDLSFDDVDRAFFAREVELQRVEQTDRFEDLEDTGTRYKLKR